MTFLEPLVFLLFFWAKALYLVIFSNPPAEAGGNSNF